MSVCRTSDEKDGNENENREESKNASTDTKNVIDCARSEFANAHEAGAEENVNADENINLSEKFHADDNVNEDEKSNLWE
jgi:hypothetical protein